MTSFKFVQELCWRLRLLVENVFIWLFGHPQKAWNCRYSKGEQPPPERLGQIIQMLGFFQQKKKKTGMTLQKGVAKKLMVNHLRKSIGGTPNSSENAREK